MSDDDMTAAEAMREMGLHRVGQGGPLDPSGWTVNRPVTLPDFLLARIAEDEAEIAAGFDFATLDSSGWMGHAAGWGRERAIAECKAKRRIVAWHRLIDGLDTDDNPVRGCGNCIASGAESPYLIVGPCMTVRLLALPYADHPHYREEWRP